MTQRSRARGPWGRMGRHRDSERGPQSTGATRQMQTGSTRVDAQNVG